MRGQKLGKHKLEVTQRNRKTMTAKATRTFTTSPIVSGSEGEEE